MSVDSPIRVESLSHRYGQRQALADVSFDVCAGEVFALLGPNGGGKTTLFRILCTAMRPNGGAGDTPAARSGRASIHGHDVMTDAAAVRRSIAVVFQHVSLDRELTVRENLRHQGKLYGLRGVELEARIDEMLVRFRLGDRARELVKKLSGGLVRRVDLAKGLLHRPSVLLLDEPSTGLDPQARWELWQFLDGARRVYGLTVLMTTHFMDEADRCDRVGIIDGGRLVAVGPPSELKEAIAGECLHVQTDDARGLMAGIRERFGVSPTVVGATVRLEHEQAHELIPRLVKAFPERIKSVSLSRPTLEEVFIHHTGRRFEERLVSCP